MNLTTPLPAGSAFAGFSGGCVSATTSCQFNLTANTTVTATFNDVQAPTAPSGLTATAVGTQINLSWNVSTDNIGVSGYWIERCPGQGSCSSPIGRINLTLVIGTTYSDMGLTPGTTYNYRVQAADAAGLLSGYSNVATAAAANPIVAISKGGTGTGTITSTPAGINCGTTCAASFASGTSITLNVTTPLPAGSTFAGFSGGCVSATLSCTVTVTTNTPVVATFNGSTGLKPPAANGAESGAGNGNGYEITPGNVTALDGAFAGDFNSGTNGSTSCTDAGKDRHQFYNYNFSIPANVTIKGITLRVDAKTDSTAGAPKICAQLSWDGGTSWTAAKNTATLGTALQAFLLGSGSDTWGRSWSAADFSNANFRVRIIDVAADNARDFVIDVLAVQVEY